MMEAFEKHGVSFVSVIQQFNTATSMGRLVLRCQEKIFSTGTAIGSVLLAGFPNECSCGGGELSSATRLGYPRRTRLTQR